MSFESKQFTSVESKERSVEEMISQAASFEELFGVLDQIGELKGSEHYPSSELKKIIDTVREAPNLLNFITRAGGLRNKVKELLEVGKEKEEALVER